MTELRYQIVLCRNEREQLTLDALAGVAGLHPDIVERFVEFGLLNPAGWVGEDLLFDATAVPRLQTIKRLRSEIGINLAGIAVILDLLDRLRASRNAEWGMRIAD
jgi:chaperone modulatory protein CbpM